MTQTGTAATTRAVVSVSNYALPLYHEKCVADEFYQADVVKVARQLLGKVLVTHQKWNPDFRNYYRNRSLCR